MARAVPARRKMLTTILGWAVGLTIFFPILWTFLTGFKTEAEAIASPPSFLLFDWTLSAYDAVNQRTTISSTSGIRWSFRSGPPLSDS